MMTNSDKAKSWWRSQPLGVRRFFFVFCAIGVATIAMTMDPATQRQAARDRAMQAQYKAQTEAEAKIAEATEKKASGEVTRAEFGDAKWAFTVDRGTVACTMIQVQGRYLPGLTFQTPDYRFVALNGVAIDGGIGEAPQNSSVYIKGKDLTALQNRARSMCK